MSPISLVICFILAISCVASSIVMACRNGRRGNRAAYLLVGLLAADFFLTLPLAWNDSNGAFWFLSLDFYNVLCMMFYEGIADSFYVTLLTTPNVEAALGIWTPFVNLYIFVILLCCTATPVCAATSAYALLTRQFSKFATCNKVKRHARSGKGTLFIFGGLDDRSIMMARSIFENASKDNSDRNDGFLIEKPLCVFTNVSKEVRESRSSIIEEFGNKPAYCYEQRAQDLLDEIGGKALAKTRDFHALFLGNGIDDESMNLGDAVSFLEFLVPLIPEDQRKGPDGFPRFHVYCACHGESDELALDSIDGATGFDIKVVDECRETVYQLLWDHPLYESLRDDPRELLDNEICRLEQENLAGKDENCLPVERKNSKSDLNIVIVGCGRYGFEALRACFWNGQIPGVNLRFHIIDKMSWQRFSSMLKHRCPGFFSRWRYESHESAPSPDTAIPGKLTAEGMFNISYYQADVDSMEFDNAVNGIRRFILEQADGMDAFQISPIAPYCIITLGNDDLNTDAAIRLRRLFAGDGEMPAIIPRVYVSIRDARKHDVVAKLRVRGKSGATEKAWQYTLQPFGGVARIFNADHLMNSKLEALALNVNASYSGLFGDNAADTTKNPNGSMLRKASAEEVWNNFLGYSAWQMNKLSSITCALGLKSKLWLLGFRIDNEAIDPDNIEDCGEALRTVLSALCDTQPQSIAELAEHPELNVLSRMEHDRWEAVYCGEGWVGMSGKTSNVFRDNGLSGGRHDCHLFLRHPYICRFEDLETVANQVERESPIRFDVDMVVNMAEMLANSKGVAKRKFSVRTNS